MKMGLMREMINAALINMNSIIIKDVDVIVNLNGLVKMVLA